MRKYFLFLMVIIASCGERDSAKTPGRFDMVQEISVTENNFKSREFRNGIYQVKERIKIPEFVGNINGLVANSGGIYISDKQHIFRYNDGSFDSVFTPNKGRGPNEVPQIFRFDVFKDSLIAIAGYPELRILTHDFHSDSTNLINTHYRGNVLFDQEGNIYGEYTNHPSSYMITKLSTAGDSLNSFGKLFENQHMSLNMFDLYWDYNEKHNLIIIGFMYVGYYIALTPEGDVEYAVESIQHPGRMPLFINSGGIEYIDEEGKTVLRWLSTNNDETHIYTASAMNRKEEVYGALIDVIDAGTGEYKFSYVLEEALHWPIVLLDDYNIASVTEGYDLVIWERVAEK